MSEENQGTPQAEAEEDAPAQDSVQLKSGLSGYLKLSVFLAGAGIMSAEMAAPRLLAPCFGTTQVIWANIIGTVLAAMTVGAFVGGKLADRWPSERAYARVLVIAGIMLALIPLISSPLLTAAAKAVHTESVGPFILTLIAICLFFAPPIFFMGMISPWAIKLAGANATDLGRRAGILSGLSAMGSIVGTFSSALFILPLLGTRRTLLLTGGLLAATGLWKAFRKQGAIAAGTAAIVFVMLVFIPMGQVKNDPNQIYEKETMYQYVQVIEKPNGVRILHLNEGLAVHSILSPHSVFTGGYWDFMTVLPTLNTEEGDELRVLILGLAAGSMALQLEHFYKDIRDLEIDGVEIDRGVIEAGREFFKLDEITSLKVHIADARTYLLRAEPGYDLIIADAYRNPYIPFHMVTREFYTQCRQLLKEDGIFAINLATAPDSSELVDSFTITMAEAFAHVGLCTTEDPRSDFQNFIFTGSNNELDLRHARNIPRLLKIIVYPRMLRTWQIPEAGDKGVVFTDDRSPIEYFTERSILKAVLEKVDS